MGEAGLQSPAFQGPRAAPTAPGFCLQPTRLQRTPGSGPVPTCTAPTLPQGRRSPQKPCHPRGCRHRLTVRAEAGQGWALSPLQSAMARRFRAELAAFFFEYDTPRMVLVRNKKVGVVFRLIQLLVLVYVVGWVFVYEKGYQTSSGLISSVSVKLKGLAVTQLPGLGPQVWDVADYVFPAQGDSSFVVMTNFIVTPKQAQGYCAEHPEGGICKEDSGCTPGKAKRKAQGIRTGKCVAFNATVKTCEIFGWCPVEVDDDIPRPALLHEAENFTLFIKNSISFPRFKVNRRNLVEEVNAAYMKTCLYHKTLHPLCPVFQLGYVVQESGQNFSTLAEKGGVVGITIDWHCDLDWHVRHCKPIYEFHGLYEEKNLSPGFNFRKPAGSETLKSPILCPWVSVPLRFT
ncbi:P2X purinoceptor 1 isoform X3 [Sapajus apella]|uniref:P2X purinoceptor n=1 Tax=Sapajus apella TaxID=9515 RepID=A0A6J3H7G4_SAPAP|nr:P2X purinoceptor 1 isoform X3 [Sapajus apella]